MTKALAELRNTTSGIHLRGSGNYILNVARGNQFLTCKYKTNKFEVSDITGDIYYIFSLT